MHRLKLVLIGLVAIGFLTAHAPTRTRVASAAAPALDRLGPVGAFALRPVHRFTADTEVKFIVGQLRQASTLGRELPMEARFAQWLKRIKLRDDGLDPWGAPYYLERARNNLTVGSRGPDGKRGTADDIRASADY